MYIYYIYIYSTCTYVYSIYIFSYYTFHFQTFVRLVSANKEEIYFVATPTNIGIYTFELDLADAAKEFFNSQSGTYEMVSHDLQ